MSTTTSEDYYATTAVVARLIGRPARTVRKWAAMHLLGRCRWSRGKRLVNVAKARETDAVMSDQPTANRDRPNPERCEPTEEELDRLIAHQMACAPDWFWDECEMLNGKEFADRLRAEYKAKKRRSA